MKNEIDRLTTIAQTLDEMSDETPELAAIAEEMGSLLERIEVSHTNIQRDLDQARQGDNLPRYLREIHGIIQREVRGAYRFQGMSEEFALAEHYRMRLQDSMRRPLPSIKALISEV